MNINLINKLNIRQISSLVGLLFCVANLIFILVISIIFKFEVALAAYAILLFVTFILTSFIARIAIQKFLLNKIRLIYKIIHSSKQGKLNPTGSFINADSTFESIEDEVAEWAASNIEEINSLKSLETYRKDYVGNISHELKTPIFAIQGFLHTLMEGGLYDDKVNMKYLERATANTDRLRTIVEDLDLITQLEENANLLYYEEFDIVSLVKEVVSEVQYHATKQNINVVISSDVNFSTVVSADRNSIRHVLTNLIINSIKYGKDDGTTRVAFYNMEDKILIEVKDDGIGIEEKHLKHLFDRFYRVDTSRSRMMGGSGLGLSIVKHIIEAHKETINVRSTVDIGSTFGFTLQKLS